MWLNIAQHYYWILALDPIVPHYLTIEIESRYIIGERFERKIVVHRGLYLCEASPPNHLKCHIAWYCHYTTMFYVIFQ